jgi:hypothetical protein
LFFFLFFSFFSFFAKTIQKSFQKFICPSAVRRRSSEEQKKKKKKRRNDMQNVRNVNVPAVTGAIQGLLGLGACSFGLYHR